MTLAFMENCFIIFCFNFSVQEYRKMRQTSFYFHQSEHQFVSFKVRISIVGMTFFVFFFLNCWVIQPLALPKNIEINYILYCIITIILNCIRALNQKSIDTIVFTNLEIAKIDLN